MTSVRASAQARILAVNALLWPCNDGEIVLYSGSQPATVEAAARGTTLARWKLPSPAFGGAEIDGSDVIATAPLPTDADVLADGKPGWFRVVQKDGATGVWQGTAGIGNAVMQFQTSETVFEVKKGAKLALTSLTYRMPVEVK